MVPRRDGCFVRTVHDSNRFVHTAVRTAQYDIQSVHTNKRSFHHPSILTSDLSMMKINPSMFDRFILISDLSIMNIDRPIIDPYILTSDLSMKTIDPSITKIDSSASLNVTILLFRT